VEIHRLLSLQYRHNVLFGGVSVHRNGRTNVTDEEAQNARQHQQQEATVMIIDKRKQYNCVTIKRQLRSVNTIVRDCLNSTPAIICTPSLVFQSRIIMMRNNI
jgi:hypothetical protein